MTSAVLVGGTGQVGSCILSNLLAAPSITTVHAYSRRDLPSSSSKLNIIKSTDSGAWPSSCPQNVPLFFSSLGTTRAAAGSLANQYKIDHDLALELAKGAKAAGATTYVLISSGGADPSSYLGYPRMKGELEEQVKKLGFEHTVILRPGLIVCQREEARFFEAGLRKIAGLAGMVSEKWLKDFWAQDSDVIAKAAVSAGLRCHEGRVTDKVVLLGQSDIVRLGRTEWKA